MTDLAFVAQHIVYIVVLAHKSVMLAPVPQRVFEPAPCRHGRKDYAVIGITEFSATVVDDPCVVHDTGPTCLRSNAGKNSPHAMRFTALIVTRRLGNTVDLFLDLETTPDLRPGALQRCIDAVEAPGQYKKAESIAEWKADNAVAIGTNNWQRTALDPMCGGIYVIGYAVEDQAPQTLWRHPEEPEAPFIEAALSTLAAIRDRQNQQRPTRFVGWNIINFDIPFLAKRCAILGIAPALRLPVGIRYNNERVLDLMTAWSGFKDYAKQRDVAAAMGIELQDETDGKDLWAVVLRDGVAAAAKKCGSDIAALQQIYGRMAPVFGL